MSKSSKKSASKTTEIDRKVGVVKPSAKAKKAIDKLVKTATEPKAVAARVIPETLPIVTPTTRGACAPFMDPVRRLLTGEGGTIAQLMEALKLSDKGARNVIDAIRKKELNPGVILNIYSQKAGRKVFRYVGLDGKGMPAKQ